MRNGFASPLLIVGIVAGVLAVGVAIQTKRLESCKADFSAFKAQVKQLGEQAEKEARAKEKANEKRIADANTERDAALKRLRERRYPGGGIVSRAPAAPAGSSQVCIGAEAYNAAFREFSQSLERFLAEAFGYAQDGDAAQIDAETLLKAWPK